MTNMTIISACFVSKIRKKRFYIFDFFLKIEKSTFFLQYINFRHFDYLTWQLNLLLKNQAYQSKTRKLLHLHAFYLGIPGTFWWTVEAWPGSAKPYRYSNRVKRSDKSLPTPLWVFGSFARTFPRVLCAELLSVCSSPCLFHEKLKTINMW